MNQLPQFSYIQIAWPDRPRWWMYLVGLLIAISINLVGQIVSFGLLYAIADNPANILDSEGAINLSGMGMHPAISLFLLVLPFVFIILGLWIAVVNLHKRSFFTLFSKDQQIDWRRFFTAFGIWMGLTAVLEIISYRTEPQNYTFSFDASAFIPLLLVSLVMLPLQTSAEEFLFRGYLMQGIGARTRRGWIAIVVTALLFAVLHMANPEIGKFGYVIVVNYLSVGILLGVLTLMDERIELALGFHAANNVYSATLVTFSGSVLQTPALFTLSELNVRLMILGWFVPAFIFLAIVARKYQWQDWGKLFRKVPEPPEENNQEEFMEINEDYLSDSDYKDSQ
jgi:uncharacterized protein